MSFSHPRRTTKTAMSAALTPFSSNASGRLNINTNMSLRKGATFHQPSTPERDLPHHFRVPSLPRRSQSTLEDVVDAHQRRIALTLGHIDRGLSAIGLEDRPPTVRQSFPDEANPVPQGFLDHTLGSPSTKSYGPTMAGVMSQEPVSNRRTLRPRHHRRPSRYSDSALGSSIGSRSGKTAAESADTAPTSVSEEPSTKSIVAASAITRSAAHSSTIANLPRLSGRASNRIQEHILKPLLAKSSLRDFHPIINDCPRRIHEKEIVCLRDLEKTLIFMAPERTKTAALYLDFCITSIRCIQATVEFLSEREQTRPNDRPYTNGYFVDLVDQIKQYAQQIQAAKEKEEKGETPGDLDAEAGDEVRLFGGLSKNGRPAELIRVKKNGKAYSIATGLQVELDEDAAMRIKRSLSEEAEDDESILRSMARRKRSASAAELAPKRCREKGCDKEFKRPCDLTKHEKTHSRPWKCPVESCKYFEYGWPTEKEAQRHHNDKHSSAPALYECHFKPCAYRSKRESNCKQHMEKAHGWTYVRSKNNGKNRDQAPSVAGLPTPQMTNMHTPSSHGEDIATPEEGSEFEMEPQLKGSDYGHNELNFADYNSNETISEFTPHHLQIDYSPQSDFMSEPSPYTANVVAPENFFEDNFANFQPGVDFPLFEEEDLYSANVQLPTPSPQIFQDHAFGQSYGSNPMPHISPIGHGNTMLYTPISNMDEGFDDTFSSNCGMDSDFQLFPSSTGGTIASSASSAMFGEMPSTINFPGASAQQLLDFYAQSVAQHQSMNSGMDWMVDDQFDYRS